MPRTIAIGDIHGCDEALAALIEAVAPQPDDAIVLLGDYIDRGPHSDRVLNRIVALTNCCRVVPLLGDHEQMLLDALADVAAMRKWLQCGGQATLHSYGWTPGSLKRALSDWIPAEHRALLHACRPYYETATHLFMHAGYLPKLPLDQQPLQALLWRTTDANSAAPHCSGKIAVVGHTPQRSGNVLDLGFLICSDTNCARGGWLTALDTGSGQIWQADGTGRLR